MIRVLFYVFSLISILLLKSFKLSIATSMIITFFILLFINYAAAFIIAARQRKVLDTDCDPQRFLKMMDRVEKRRGKEPKVATRIAVNRGAGYICLGKYQIAKEYLEGLDTKYLSEKDGSFLIYSINLAICYYELGELEKAEQLYETNLIKLSPMGKRTRRSVEILIGERYYYLGKYELCYEHLDKLRSMDLEKRQYLGILFRLAQIELARGETEQAIKKLKKIEKLGNQLWVVEGSRELLEKLQV